MTFNENDNGLHTVSAHLWSKENLVKQIRRRESFLLITTVLTGEFSGELSAVILSAI